MSKAQLFTAKRVTGAVSLVKRIILIEMRHRLLGYSLKENANANAGLLLQAILTIRNCQL